MDNARVFLPKYIARFQEYARNDDRNILIAAILPYSF